MLWQRILSALVGIPLIITVVWFGQLPLIILTGLIMFFGYCEIRDILFEDKKQPAGWLAALGGFLLLGSVYFYKDDYLALTMVTILMINLLAPLFFYPHFSPRDGAVNFYATLYISMIVYLYLLRVLPDGTLWLIFTLVSIWCIDTAAYFVGKTLGKHRLAPKLSPHKTLEGGIGGLLGSLFFAYIFHFFYPAVHIKELLLLGALVGVIGQVGDLVESVFKRSAGVKDSGRLIPGHGGVLDRFDSLLFAAPLVYYYVSLTIIS